MSTVKATHFEHPSASTAGITLAADGSVALPQGFTGGLGTNVVQTVKTGGFSTTSTTFTTVTGLTATITPTTNTSKVLVIINFAMTTDFTDRAGAFAVRRASTDLYIADTVGSNLSGSFVTSMITSRTQNAVTLVFLDSPATTSATTYALSARRGAAGTVYIGRTSTAGSSDPDIGRSASSITLIEVAA